MAARTVVGIVFRRVMGQHGKGRAREMSRQLGRGEGGIAIDACVEDGLVLLGRDRQRAGHALDVEPAIAVGVIVELANRAQQAIAGVGEQREMELAVERLPLPQVVAGDRFHPTQTAAKRVDIALGETGHVDADRKRLVDDAHRVELFEVVDRKRGDAAAPVHFGFDEPLALEHAHGLAERSAADAELTGELDLRHDSPGGSAPLRMDSRRLLYTVHVMSRVLRFPSRRDRFGGGAECGGLGWKCQEVVGLVAEEYNMATLRDEQIRV